MTRVTLDAATCAKLGNLKKCLELCDESGRTLGYFTPAEDRSLYEGVQPTITDEQLERREREQGGRTLKEILTDLDKRG